MGVVGAFPSGTAAEIVRNTAALLVVWSSPTISARLAEPVTLLSASTMAILSSASKPLSGFATADILVLRTTSKITGRGSRGGRSLKPEIFGGNHPITNVRRVFSCRIWDPEKKNGYRLCTADRTPYIARRTKLLGPTAVPLSTNTDPSREEDTPYRPYRRPNPSLPLHASLASTSTPPPTRGP